MVAPIRIGIMGDFEPSYHSHFATNAALYDAATKLKVPLEVRWLPTPSLEGPAPEKILRHWDGLSDFAGKSLQKLCRDAAWN